MSIKERLVSMFTSKTSSQEATKTPVPKTRELHGKGRVATPENSVKYTYNQMTVNTEVRSTICDIRYIDKVDARVKKIHKRMARDTVKGGLRIKWIGEENKRITKLFSEFLARTQLKRREKLESDARGLVMEGTLPLQMVLNKRNEVTALVRMPAETIIPNVNENGTFIDLKLAYSQVDPLTLRKLATFPFWQLELIRIEPDNFDDHGSMGRPYLDASRKVWRQVNMTEEDLVVRRRERAPQKRFHVLEGASETELNNYRLEVEEASEEIQTDYFSNKKGTIQTLEGDANLDQIADVAHLIDTFFAGAPAPKGLFGYTEDLARDVLEDLKKDYFEEIDGLQDALAHGYEQLFRLQLLLKGINPARYEFEVLFKERQTSTRNQQADLALKYQAMGAPIEMVWESAGIDAVEANNKLKQQKNKSNPYPDPHLNPESEPPKKANVAVTPGNAPKGESSTTISTRS